MITRHHDESILMHLSAVSLASHITRCTLADWHSRPLLSADSPSDSLETCTLHDPLSLYKFSVDDILKIILRSRKSWKTLKGRSEAVWPPYLEATMLKGLQEYEPDDSRETRMLGRYPMRNRFISDYIHNTTGKYRSAKQVGSRLQQLRDTAEGRELIDVLTRCYHTRTDTGASNAQVPTPPDPSSSPPFSTISWDSSSPPPSSDSPVTPTSPVMSPQSRQPAKSRMLVYIDILPQQSPWSSSMNRDSSSPSALLTSNSDSRPSDAARSIRNIDPTVTFVAPAPVNGKSSYIVLLDGAPVHEEDTMLEDARPYFSSSRSSNDEPVLYNTALVPKYWDVLCDTPDPTLYTIMQDVYHMPDPVPPHRARPVPIFSAIYHFRYPSSAADSAVSHEQPPMESGSSVTSAFDNQMMDGSMSVDFGHATSFQVPYMYAAPPSEDLRTPTGLDQNRFDEPFTLDVNFDQLVFDELLVNMDNVSDSPFTSQYYSKDPSGFM